MLTSLVYSHSMKILYTRLTKQEAAQLCSDIKLVARIKLRLQQILEIDTDPKDDAVAQRLSYYLLEGDALWIDRKNHKIVISPPAYVETIEKIPEEAPLPDLFYFIKSTSKHAGPVDWNTFESLLPNWELEDVMIWHQRLTEWVSLSKIRAVLEKN